jgi:hypothetical protein
MARLIEERGYAAAAMVLIAAERVFGWWFGSGLEAYLAHKARLARRTRALHGSTGGRLEKLVAAVHSPGCLQLPFRPVTPRRRVPLCTVAYGDLMTAILALLALATLRVRNGTVATWVFNIFGTADLLFGFYQGSRISLPATPGLLGAGYFILAAYVPLLLITHGFAFRILLRTKIVVPSRNKLSAA